MKTLLFYILISPTLVFAKTEIIQAGNGGFSHIDPLDNQAYIGVMTDLQNGEPRMRVRCAIDKTTNKPVKNYFVFKMPDANGILRNFNTVQPGFSCAEIEKDHQETLADGTTSTVIKGCQEFSAPEVTVEEPEEGKCGANANEPCTRLAQPVEKQLRPINLNADSVVKARDLCGGANNPLILVRDLTSTHSLFSNLSGESFCKMDKRRVLLDGAPWDNANSPYMHIYTSNNPGFNVGAMINKANANQPDSVFNYNYDFEKKSWCQHILPDYGNSAPTCDPAFGNGETTFPLSYSPPYGGIVKLTVDANGTPIAYIGQPSTAPHTGSKFPLIDESKPVMKITLSKSSAFGASTVFESKPNMNGTTIRTMTASSTYTLGNRFNATQAANSCDASMCLRAPPQFVKDAGNLACSNNYEPLSLKKSNSDVCYSCNGVTPGNCNPSRESTGEKDANGNDAYKSLKVMLTSENSPSSLSLLGQCRGGTNTTQPDNGQDPIIDQ